MQEKFNFDGATRDFVEANAEDDDVRAERPRLGNAGRGACEALAHEGERGLDRVAAELLVGAVGDHAPPASLPVGVVSSTSTQTRGFSRSMAVLRPSVVTATAAPSS